MIKTITSSAPVKGKATMASVFANASTFLSDTAVLRLRLFIATTDFPSGMILQLNAWEFFLKKFKMPTWQIKKI